MWEGTEARLSEAQIEDSGRFQGPNGAGQGWMSAWMLDRWAKRGCLVFQGSMDSEPQPGLAKTTLQGHRCGNQRMWTHEGLSLWCWSSSQRWAKRQEVWGQFQASFLRGVCIYYSVYAQKLCFFLSEVGVLTLALVCLQDLWGEFEVRKSPRCRLFLPLKSVCGSWFHSGKQMTLGSGTKADLLPCSSTMWFGQIVCSLGVYIFS